MKIDIKKDLEIINEEIIAYKHFEINEEKLDEFVNKMVLYLEKLNIILKRKDHIKKVDKINIIENIDKIKNILKKYKMSKELQKEFDEDWIKLFKFIENVNSYNNKLTIEKILNPNLKKEIGHKISLGLKKALKEKKLKNIENQKLNDEIHKISKVNEEYLSSIWKEKDFKHEIEIKKNNEIKQVDMNLFYSSIQQELFCLMQRYNLRKIKMAIDYNKFWKTDMNNFIFRKKFRENEKFLIIKHNKECDCPLKIDYGNNEKK